MTEQQKQWIDNASYEDLLRKWRHTPIGDKMLQSDTGEYYQKVMAEKREKISDSVHTRASKNIGWD